MELTTKRITNDGRIQIPKKWRDEMELEKNEHLLLSYDNNSKVIKFERLQNIQNSNGLLDANE